MSFRCRLTLTIATLCLTCSFIACGGDPPDKEIQQAEAAIAAAQADGADKFAADEFKAAQESLAHAREAVTARDYRLALNDALDSRERAVNSAAQASAAIASARSAADGAISAATTAMVSAKAALQVGEATHAPSRTVAALRAAVSSADAQLQKARTAWEGKDFFTASAAASAASEQLAAMSDDLDALTPAGKRRK